MLGFAGVFWAMKRGYYLGFLCKLMEWILPKGHAYVIELFMGSAMLGACFYWNFADALN